MSKRRFSTRRGRPRTRRTAPDKGTPELQAKRSAGLTCEAIDLCRSRNLISDSEYWCALHFRWLYTMRFGCAHVRALDLCGSHGSRRPLEDTPWLQARSKEYREAALLLEKEGVLSAVLRVAVFDEAAFVSPDSRKLESFLGSLRLGLALLQDHWQGRHALTVRQTHPPPC